MKTIYNHITFLPAIFLVFFTSCVLDNLDDGPSTVEGIIVDLYGYTIPEAFIKIKTTQGADSLLASETGYYKFVVENGGGIATLTCSKNPYFTKSVDISFKSGENLHKKVTLLMNPDSAYFYMKSYSIDIKNNIKEEFIPVSTNLRYYIESSVTWMSFKSFDKDGFIISLETNEKGKERYGMLIIHADLGRTYRIIVTQEN